VEIAATPLERMGLHIISAFMHVHPRLIMVLICRREKIIHRAADTSQVGHRPP
jgi:hypothetical protein